MCEQIAQHRAARREPVGLNAILAPGIAVDELAPPEALGVFDLLTRVNALPAGVRDRADPHGIQHFARQLRIQGANAAVKAFELSGQQLISVVEFRDSARRELWRRLFHFAQAHSQKVAEAVAVTHGYRDGN